MGGRVTRFRVGREGGHIVTDRNNFWIALAPYFFPLYSLLVIGVYGALGLFFNVQPYGRLLYGLTDRLLQVVRGWLFHTDTIVPFVRVQHLDVTRGPLDKMFGTASLVIHTAGTHNSTVTLPAGASNSASARPCSA